MYRIGFAKDIHELVENRKLILGGIIIPYEKGEKAHSDGDVLFHALSEAILGALALGDLGTHFPDNDDKYLNYDSSKILLEVRDMMLEKGYDISNIDISVVLERPKLKDYILDIRKNVASLLKIDLDQISIKAGTNEKMDAIGQGLAIEANAIVLLKRK